MPSATALRIAIKASEFLRRELNGHEQEMCEELALNLYPKAVIQYIDRLTRKKAPKQFSMIYQPCKNMLIRWSRRRDDWICMKGRMRNVYNKVGQFVGDGFSERELDSIIFLSDDCSDAEIDAAIAYSRGRGIHNASYLKAVILGNRKRYTLGAIRRGKLAQYIPEVATLRALDVGIRKVPNIDRIRDLWRFRVRQAVDKIELIQAELNAKKAVYRGSKPDRPDKGRAPSP